MMHTLRRLASIKTSSEIAYLYARFHDDRRRKGELTVGEFLLCCQDPAAEGHRDLQCNVRPLTLQQCECHLHVCTMYIHYASTVEP